MLHAFALPCVIFVIYASLFVLLRTRLYLYCYPIICVINILWVCSLPMVAIGRIHSVPFDTTGFHYIKKLQNICTSLYDWLSLYKEALDSLFFLWWKFLSLMSGFPFLLYALTEYQEHRCVEITVPIGTCRNVDLIYNTWY